MHPVIVLLAAVAGAPPELNRSIKIAIRPMGS